MFNNYKHWATLMIRSNHGSGILIYSKEGAMQGCPLAMVGYGIMMLPLICKLKTAYPDVEQLWYADDAGAGGKFAHICTIFIKLMRWGHDFGYFPEPTKSILVTSPKNVERAKEVFGGLGFQVKTGNCYLGSFIGELDACDEWIQEKINDWAWAMKELAAMAMAFPQLAYAGMQKSLQHEWQFIQCIVPDIGEKFEAVKVLLHKHFLPVLFKESLEEDDPRLSLASLPVKKAGLALPNLVATANSNYKASLIVCGHLTQAICGKHEFSSADHSATM